MDAGEQIAIVGAGHAGVAIALRLRERGFAGRILLIGDEPSAPYQRPPLTKDFLRGRLDVEALSLAGDLAAQGIDHRAGVSVAAIDREARQLRLADGSRVGYHRLALATGSRARRLDVPGATEAPLHYLTTMADCLALRARLEAVDRIAIVGGGFIGLEAAATLRGLGKAVTLIEAQPRLLARSASPALSAYLAALHEAHGVGLRLGTGVAAIEGRSVRCRDGASVAADAIVVGIGALPNDELARAAGLACDDGILVDRHGRTSDPAIVAAGDCTRHPNDFAAGSPCRLESVQNAADQALSAADSLCGLATPYAAAPTFWSDQFDARIGIVGIGDGAEEVVTRGDVNGGAFSTFAFRGGRLVAIESVNRPKDQRLARRVLMSTAIAPHQVRDPDTDLAALAAA